MNLSYQEQIELAEDLREAVGGRYDGSKKNILVNECPYCGKTGYKFGIYIGQARMKKRPFMSHCFSCGWSNRGLEGLLQKIGRMDLMPHQTTKLDEKIGVDSMFKVNVDDDPFEEMSECKMPKTYLRKFNIKYLKDRGFTFKDFNYFEVGQTKRGNVQYKDYVIFPIYEDGVVVGYVSRHTWSKQKIDKYNDKTKYKILRYRNSTEEEGNDFAHLIYNIDAVVEGETSTVILVEGIFDVIALTRKLNLYETNSIAVCATFGKQITDSKMEKLQRRGVEKIIVGYDGDASKYVVDAANTLDDYFDVLVADIDDEEKDWDDLDVSEIIDIFANKLYTPIEYNFKKLKI